MPSLRGDGLGRGLVVAGRHDDLEAERVQLGDGLGGCRLDRIGDGDEPGKLAADGEEHHRLAVACASPRRVAASGAASMPAPCIRRCIAEQHLVARRSVP